MTGTVLGPSGPASVASWSVAALGHWTYGIAADPLTISLTCGLLGVTVMRIGNRASREQDRRARRDRVGRRLDRYVSSSAAPR